MSDPAPPLIQAAIDVQSVLTRQGIQSCVIGGLAVQRWGEPRATQDVDLSVLAPVGAERRPLDLLLGAFSARRHNAREFAITHRVLLIEAGNRVPVDVALAGSPFEIEVLERSSPWTLGDAAIVTCSAEDLVLYKLVASRPRDVADVEGVVRRRQARLDVERIRRYGALFAELKEQPNLLRPFEHAWAQVTGRAD